MSSSVGRVAAFPPTGTLDSTATRRLAATDSAQDGVREPGGCARTTLPGFLVTLSEEAALRIQNGQVTRASVPAAGGHWEDLQCHVSSARRSIRQEAAFIPQTETVTRWKDISQDCSTPPTVYRGQRSHEDTRTSEHQPPSFHSNKFIQNTVLHLQDSKGSHSLLSYGTSVTVLGSQEPTRGAPWTRSVCMPRIYPTRWVPPPLSLCDEQK